MFRKGQRIPSSSTSAAKFPRGKSPLVQRVKPVCGYPGKRGRCHIPPCEPTQRCSIRADTWKTRRREFRSRGPRAATRATLRGLTPRASGDTHLCSSLFFSRRRAHFVAGGAVRTCERSFFLRCFLRGWESAVYCTCHVMYMNIPLAFKFDARAYYICFRYTYISAGRKCSKHSNYNGGNISKNSF